jgi:hypothetical protein
MGEDLASTDFLYLLLFLHDVHRAGIDSILVVETLEEGEVALSGSESLITFLRFMMMTLQ